MHALLDAALKLVEAANRQADETLGPDLAGIVKLHAGLAVGAALIPVPGVDLAAGATNIWSMYVRINKKMNLPFAENVVKSLASGVATNLGAACAALAVGEVLKFFPGVGTFIGAAVEASTLFAITVVSGMVYFKILASVLRSRRGLPATEEDLRTEAERVLSDKQFIKDSLKEAKKSYRKTKAAGV
jgi:uncharacterized protein (DUF697 family)